MSGADAASIVLQIQRYFDASDPADLLSEEWWHNAILYLGLNDEILGEQPPELAPYFGGGLGLRIWQYPTQFAPYMAAFSGCAQTSISSYLEIGCRHGGTFIAHAEALRRTNPQFTHATAVDLISPGPILSAYISSDPRLTFVQGDSRHLSFAPHDLVFIDGDHSFTGVATDAEKVNNTAKFLVFHDISNIACPGVGAYWADFKQRAGCTHSFAEFTQQYTTVGATYLGIGVAARLPSRFLEE